MKRSKTARFLVLSTLLALLPVIFTQWRNFFPAPPQLASPSSNSGFVLHKIREQKDYPLAPYVVVLTPPWLPTVSRDENRIAFYAPEDAFRVTAIASTGTRWNLGWHVADKREDPDLPDRQLLLFHLPRIYPTMYEWLDIEIQNKRGATAKWRLTGLSKGVHTAPSPQELNPAYADDGLFIHAHAQAIKANYKPWVPVQGSAGFYPVARPDAGHYWKIGLIDQDLEWAERRVGWGQKLSATYWVTAPETPAASPSYAKSRARGGGLGLSIPYPPDNRFARLTLRVEKYASAGDSGGTLVSSRVIELTCPITVHDITHLKPKTPTPAAPH